MIIIETCHDCKHFKGIKHKDITKSTAAYALCEIAKSGNANELLLLENGKIICNKKEVKEYDLQSRTDKER